jgi:hypothetical protein
LLYVALLGACGFSSKLQDTPSDGQQIDAPAIDAPEAEIDAPPPDAQQCFGTGFGMRCLPALPPGPRQLSTTQMFDTGVDTNCTHVMMVGGVESCVLTGTTVTRAAGGTFRAIGTRPLVIVATEMITIDGIVSVSSLRGQGTGAGSSIGPCATPNQGEDDAGGGGGGAGGSFMSTGGNGGNGDTNGSPGDGGTAATAMQAPTTLRGGCAGGRGGNATDPGGAGSPGGGAVYLVAGMSIRITGGVFAAGMGGSLGGTRGGGGGGGSGGLIGLDAPTITVDGSITANGGGGGEGGGFGNGGNGSDGLITGTRAPGGMIEPDGGNGGGGGALAGLAGLAGGPSAGGGGGGGGGVGYIYVKGTLAGTPIVISPAASVN